MINLKDYNVKNPVESLDEYGDGGLYPIHINDKFQDGRYEILHKLGFGAFSTVWAARDHHKNTNVALKVMKAENSENNQELRMLQLIQNDTTHPGSKYLPQLLDHFYEGIFERKNLFLVLELLGPTIRIVSLHASEHRCRISRQISKQLLQAIDCLHSHGISHGGVYEGNILFRLPKNTEIDFDTVNQGEVSRKDGAPLEKGVPRYLVETLRFEGQFDKAWFEKLDHIQLVDFSSSFFDSAPPKLIDTPPHVSPPEKIFRRPLSKSVDIWGLACMTFYFATGQQLFETLGDDRRIISQIHKCIGESSAHWLLTAFIEAVADKVWEDLPFIRIDHSDDDQTLEQMVLKCYNHGKGVTSDAEKKDSGALEQYLRKTLIVDPLKRPTTKELQTEEWVQIVDHETTTV